MIVICPNCSLQQPLDPFCAGCGKQLPKLLAEQKRKAKNRNKRTQKFILLSLVVFGLGSYLYYAYQNPGARPFAQNVDEPKIKVIIPKGKITAPRYKQKDFSKSMKVKSFTVTKDTKPQPAVKPPPKAPTKDPTVEKAVPSLAVQEVYLIDAGDCTNSEVESGPLSNDELTFFLDCSKILFKIGGEETVEVDPGLPFTNSAAFAVTDKRVALNFEFAFEDPPFKFTKSFGLNQTSLRKAGHLSRILPNKLTSSYILEKSPVIQKEMLGSYASSLLLGLLKDDKPSPKGYFLAVYE